MKTPDEYKKELDAQYAKLIKEHGKQYAIAKSIWSMLHAGDIVYMYDKSPMHRGYLAYTILRFDVHHMTAKLQRHIDDRVSDEELLDLCIMSEQGRIRKLRKLIHK